MVLFSYESSANVLLLKYILKKRKKERGHERKEKKEKQEPFFHQTARTPDEKVNPNDFTGAADQGNPSRPCPSALRQRKKSFQKTSFPK